jgi:hypothetical protein
MILLKMLISILVLHVLLLGLVDTFPQTRQVIIILVIVVPS